MEILKSKEKNMKMRFALLLTLLFASTVNAALITNDKIFGSGNVNRGFTVATFGDLELALRAKQRYTSPNDALGVGIVQDIAGNYLFDSTGQTVPSNRALWSFDWSINSDIVDGSDPLNTYNYIMRVDYDPSAAINFIEYDPLGIFGTGFYLGTNATDNGASSFSVDMTQFGSFNLAQNSVNYGFLPGAPLGSGQYRIELQAPDASGQLIGASAIDVYVDTTPVNAPASFGMLILAMSGLIIVRLKK